MNNFINKLSRPSFKVHISVAMFLWIINSIVMTSFLLFFLTSYFGDSNRGIGIDLIIVLICFVICIYGLIRFTLQAPKTKWINFYPYIFIITIVIPYGFFAINYILIMISSIYSHLRELYLIIWFIGMLLYAIGLYIFFRSFRKIFAYASFQANGNENDFSRRDYRKNVLLLIICISVIVGINMFYRLESGRLRKFCSLVINQYLREYCYSGLAVDKRDLSICDKSGHIKDSCYADIAIIKSDLSICNLIKDENTKAWCIKSISEK